MKRLPICLFAILAQMVASPASSTVLEYGTDGSVQITQQTLPAPQAPPARTGALAPLVGGDYRSLAEATAWRYAGEEGVRAVGLDAFSFVNLFTAMISAESAFDPTAVSSAGAMGLGQLMPETAAGLGVHDPFDPAQNLDGAARYLVAQLARFRSVDLGLAAYNAGPERVAAHGGIPPIAETRNFVAVVMSRAGIPRVAVPANSESVGVNDASTQTPAVIDFTADGEPREIDSVTDTTPAGTDDEADRSVLFDDTRPGVVRATASTDQRGTSVWQF